MTLTAGAITVVSTQSNTAVLTVAAATSGTGPYTYQWYRSTTNGFTPGGGNILTGQTGQTLNDSGLIPNTPYYYANIVTDSVAATSTSAQATLTTALQQLSSNTVAQGLAAGVVDLKATDGSVFPAMVDITQSGNLYPGQAVKIVDNAGGPPKVVACSASTDACIGFVRYDFIHQFFVAGQALEVVSRGAAVYLYATTAIPRFSRVTLDVTSPAGVGVLVGSSGKSIVGFAYDKAVSAGQLIRVVVDAPTFAVA